MSQSSKRFSIGIDLGTTNSVCAIWDSAKDIGPEILPISQLAAANAVEERSALPSFVYCPGESEFPTGSLQLEGFNGLGTSFAGHFAKEHGALSPERLIHSAKSWLCHRSVDPQEAILPWNASEDAPWKQSPLRVATLFLEQIRFSLERQYHPSILEESECVLTVPASFDDTARSLTLTAARDAGFHDITILEEPLAAFYAWLQANEGTWREHIEPGETVLVCDVGGGTADFTLIGVLEENGSLQLERISVGEHILLGGDNMDLALAYTIKAKLEAANTPIDDWQFVAVTHAARRAKEQLLATNDFESVPISIPSRGSSLFAQTITSELTREEVTAVAVDGFLPIVEVGEACQRGAGAGLQELGLPFASDPAITRHLAAFLRNAKTQLEQRKELASLLPGSVRDSHAQPTAILFNGGVFNSGALRTRLQSQLSWWNPTDAPTRQLSGMSLDSAVACGASYYARLIASDQGIRVRAGTSHAYYLGIASSMPAVPGVTPPVNGLCIVPQNTDEGADLLLPDKEFGLVVGEPATFRFFSSASRPSDTIGTVVPNAAGALEESRTLEATLPADELDGLTPGTPVPVRLRAHVTEMGMLELYMEHREQDSRWKLEWNVRAQ